MPREGSWERCSSRLGHSLQRRIGQRGKSICSARGKKRGKTSLINLEPKKGEKERGKTQHNGGEKRDSAWTTGSLLWLESRSLWNKGVNGQEKYFTQGGEGKRSNGKNPRRVGKRPKETRQFLDCKRCMRKRKLQCKGGRKIGARNMPMMSLVGKGKACKTGKSRTGMVFSRFPKEEEGEGGESATGAKF